jgi:hypothetical protein
MTMLTELRDGVDLTYGLTDCGGQRRARDGHRGSSSWRAKGCDTVLYATGPHRVDDA